jgi:hypothetical protein
MFGWRASPVVVLRRPLVSLAAPADHEEPMSYSMKLLCGCTIYVAGRRGMATADTRVLELKGPRCRDRRHVAGVRIWLWEMLPNPSQPPRARRARALPLLSL